MVINVRKKLKRETIIRPHWVLLFQGRAFMFLMYAFNVVLLYQVVFRFENIGVMGIILLIVLIPLCVFLNVFFALRGADQRVQHLFFRILPRSDLFSQDDIA